MNEIGIGQRGAVAMETKRIDLGQSVFSLCSQYPEVADVLAELGFSDITKPGMLESVGRFMTIPKGAALKKIPLADVRAALERHGFSIDE